MLGLAENDKRTIFQWFPLFIKALSYRYMVTKKENMECIAYAILKETLKINEKWRSLKEDHDVMKAKKGALE